jgi:hypothetical protein
MNLWSFNYAAAFVFETRSQHGDGDVAPMIKSFAIAWDVREISRSWKSIESPIWHIHPSHLTENRLRVVGRWPRIKWLRGGSLPRSL